VNAAQVLGGMVGGGMATTLIVGVFAAASASAGTVGAAVGAPIPSRPVEVAAVAPVVGSKPVLLARTVQSPCAASTARYRAAQAELAGGDIDAADDLAVIAAVLIEQCNWTPVDAALGGRNGRA
jgi:hypothetical protein